MVDFTTSYIGGEPDSPVRPQQPSVDQSSLVGARLLGDAVSGLAGVATNYIKIQREEEKARVAAELQAKEDQAVSTFARDQLKLVDATEMGDISSSEARMRMRANLSRAIADNPALAVDLGKAHTSVIKSTGLGDVVYEGTEQEKQQRIIETDALKAGWVTPSMSQAQKDVATSRYQSFKLNQTMLEDQAKRLAVQKAQVTLTTAGITQRSAKLELAERQAKISTQQAIGGMVNDFSANLLNKLEEIRVGKEEGKYTAEQATMLADQAAYEIQQTINIGGARAGSDYVNNMTKPMLGMVENYKKYISGQTKLETLNIQNETVVATQTAMIQGDPEVARIVTLTKLFPNARAVVSGEANTAVAGIIKSGMDPTTKSSDMMPDTAEGKKDVGTYLNMVDDSMDQINKGSAVDPEETKIELDNHLNSVLNSVVQHGPSSNTKDFKQVIDFLASNKFGKYVSTQGANLNEQSKLGAETLLADMYSRELYPLVQKAYKEANTGGSATISYYGRTEVPGVKDQKKATDVIKPVFTGSGVVFQAAPGDTNPITRRKVKELNETAGTLLNKMLHSAAHLQGTTDYKSVYQNMFEQQIFGVEEEAPKE